MATTVAILPVATEAKVPTITPSQLPPNHDAIETLNYQGAVTHWHFTPEDHTGQKKSEALQTAKWENGALKVVFRATSN